MNRKLVTVVSWLYSYEVIVSIVRCLIYVVNPFTINSALYILTSIKLKFQVIWPDSRG